MQHALISSTAPGSHQQRAPLGQHDHNYNTPKPLAPVSDCKPHAFTLPPDIPSPPTSDSHRFSVDMADAASSAPHDVKDDLGSDDVKLDPEAAQSGLADIQKGSADAPAADGALSSGQRQEAADEPTASVQESGAGKMEDAEMALRAEEPIPLDAEVDMDLNDEEDKTVVGIQSASETKFEPASLAPPSFTPSPSPPASPRNDVLRVKVEGSTSPVPKQEDLAATEKEDEQDRLAMERSSSHASASSSTDRKIKKRASALPPQLINHLPRAEKEALATFTQLSSNDYHDKKLGKARGAFDAMVCDCSFTPGVDDEILACSAHSDCINRATQIECVASECNCGTYCQNQRFQRRQYADVEIVLTELKGFGLRAGKHLPKETFVYEYVGEVMNEPMFLQRMQQYRVEGIRHFYFMMLQKGEYLDATKKGGKGRFINHSCNPNCYVAKWQVGKHMRMGIFAKRNIAQGEELTFDYNVDRYGNDAQTCHCGEPNCVGTLGGKTQTDIGGIADLFIQALGIEDQVEEMGARGSKKRKSKELDKDFVPILRPVKHEEVFKVMTGIRQANANQQILQKLLTRVEMTEDPDVQKILVKLHGFDAMYGVLVDWKDDRNIIMLALSSLARWPLIAKNKVVDSGVEAQVQSLRDFYRERADRKAAEGEEADTKLDDEAKEDLSVSARAEQLLDAWDKLDMGYRIARREADDAADEEAAQRDPGYGAYVDRRRMHDLDEQPVTLEEAQAPTSVSEELGKPMPEWTRSEIDMPMRQLPAGVGRQPSRLNGRGGGYFTPSRGIMSGGLGPRNGHSPRTPDQLLPNAPSPFGKLGASLKPSAPATPSQSIQDIIRQANEEEERRRKEAEAQARAAREAELQAVTGSSSPRKHARPGSTSASSHADKRRRGDPTHSSSSRSAIGVDFNEDGSTDLASAGGGGGGSGSSSSNEKKLRRMIGEIVVKQMSKHKDELERETFKKYAKELTNVIVTKEMKNPKTWPPPRGEVEELPNEKRTKVKAFCVEYIAKLLARKGKGKSNGVTPTASATRRDDDAGRGTPPSTGSPSRGDVGR